MVNAGGTFGGSALGGAVGMTGSGTVTINSGGYLLPGGGYYVLSDSAGYGGPNWAPAGSAGTQAVAVDPAFHRTVGPAFHVLGDLNVNGGAQVNYNFNGSSFDTIDIGGALNLAQTGAVTINLNSLGGGIGFNGVPLFSGFTSFTLGGGMLASGSTISATSITLTGSGGINPTGDYLKLVNNQVDLISPSTAAQYLIWNGSIAGSGSNSSNYLWDTSTQNFSAGGVSSAYVNNRDAAVFDDTASNTVVTIASSGVTPAALAFNNHTKTYTIQGGAIGGGVGPVIQGGGTVIFANTNSYTGATLIENNSTLQVNSVSALPAGQVVNLQGNSTLALNYSDAGSTSTYAGQINFQSGVPAVNVPTGTVTLAGVINTAAAGLAKTGSGTLLLSNAANSTGGAYNGTPTDINGGFLELNSVNSTVGQSYSALGAEPINIAYAGAVSGGGLWLNNVKVGVEQNQAASTGDGLGYVYLFTGGTLKGTGAGAALARTNASAVLNWNGSVYSPGNVYLATGTSRSDVLSLQEAFEQFDPNYFQANEWVNYDLQSGGPGGLYMSGSNATNAAYLVTAHVQGAGTVRLQTGDSTTSSAFGGAWSVESGILQLGPVVSMTAALPYTSMGAGQWDGAGGEVFNALGMKVAYTNTGNVNGAANPDLPNRVTVQSGGMLAIANDQINENGVEHGPATPNSSPTYTSNGLPAYYRNTITLNGGTLAVTGAEVTWNYLSSSSSASQGVITQSNSAVVARLGGSFDPAAGVTSTILTYDPNGLALDSTGSAIAADGITRTVELVGGTRTLYNASPGLPFISGSGTTTTDSGLGFMIYTTSSSVTLQYETNWAGNLLVASSNGLGGTFNIKRSGGSVSVAPSSSMTIQSGSTVNISNDDSSTLMASTVSDTTYGFLTAGTAGILPVMNYALTSGTAVGGSTAALIANSVAIVNAGTFNVNAGTQAVNMISGPGTLNVTAGTPTLSSSATTLYAGSISQATANIGPGATLNLVGPGVVANSMVVANSGNLNVTGGTHSVGTVGTSGTLGATSVSGAGTVLGAGLVLQNSATVSNGAALVLTAPFANNFSTFNSITVQTGKIDVGQSGFFLPSGDVSGASAVFKQIQAGYANGTWSGSAGVTSSLAAGNPTAYAVGYGTAMVNGTPVIQVATTIPGDAFLEFTVGQDDKNLVFGSNSNYLKPGEGWSGGNFHYVSSGAAASVTNADRQIVIQNFNQPYNPPGTPTPLGAFGPAMPAFDPPAVTSTSQQIVYNSLNGDLSLVVTSSADLNALTVYLENPSGTALVLSNSWSAAFASDSLQAGAQDDGGVAGEIFQPGTYVLADLAPGLSAAAFGNGVNGPNNAIGSVLFYDSNYSSVSANVEIVPEPGSLALLAAGMAVAGGLAWRRRFRRLVS